MPVEFPSAPEQEKDKTPTWSKNCLMYGLSILDFRQSSGDKDTRLYRSYNGIRDPKSLLWITKTYGQETRSKFVSYKVGRSKHYLLDGEWLRRPLNVTVETINIQARSEKMDQMDLLVGAMLSKNELQTLKDVAGVDVMEGVPVPENEDDPLWQKMSPKDKQEAIMQTLINEQIPNLDLKRKFSELFKDARIVSKCFGKVEITEKGDVDFYRIDPRDMIYEEIEGDDFLQHSTVKGARRWMPIHEVLIRYSLTDEDRKKLENCRNQTGRVGDFRFRMLNNQVMVEVVHMEWKSSKPSYYKIMKKTPMQLEYDSATDEIIDEIPAAQYEENKAKYDKAVSKGLYRIEVKHEEDLWEGTSLGRIVFADMRRKPFQLRRHDHPAYILDGSYVGCLFGTTDGVRVSLQELIENFDLQYDICEYQIMKELNRAKGKALLYDLAGTPKNTTAEKILYQIVNDGFATFNSMASGNVMNRNLDLQNAIKELDLGFSSSFPQLLQLQNQIISNMDRITGINDFREGGAPASSTVTNAQQALQNSRTITEPLFFMMQEFVKVVMLRIVEATKVSYAFYKADRGDQILGTDGFQYMKITNQLGYRDYGVHIEDGSKYARLREKMDQWMEYGLNSKQVSMVDAAKYELAETTAEAKQIFEDAFVRMQQFEQQMAQQQQQSQAAMSEKALQTKVQLDRESREDNQEHDLSVVAAKAEGQIKVDDNRIEGKLIENSQKGFENSITS